MHNADFNGPYPLGGTLCPACRNSAGISASKCWKILHLNDFALISIACKMV